ncbi:MAG: type II secretion system F family protein [Syntrophomonas sp.]
MEAIISALTFMTVVFVIVGVNSVKVQKSDYIKKRLNNITREFQEDTTETKIGRSKLDFTSLLNFLGKGLIFLSFTKKIETELSKADMLLRVEEFIGLNILTAVGGGLIGFLLSGGGPPVVMLALLGTIIPWFFVYWKKGVRAVELNREIGESLTGMSNSLRAGYSFQQAMDMVSKETIGPLAIEYRRTLREINLGITTEQALQNLIQRADNEDLDLMIGAVLIQRQIGGNLAEIFDNIADTIRQRIRMQGEVKTLTAQGRISGLIIGALPVALFFIIMVINPDYLSVLLERQVGWYLLGGAMISEIIGFVFISKITNINF